MLCQASFSSSRDVRMPQNHVEFTNGWHLHMRSRGLIILYYNLPSNIQLKCNWMVLLGCWDTMLTSPVVVPSWKSLIRMLIKKLHCLTILSPLQALVEVSAWFALRIKRAWCKSSMHCIILYLHPLIGKTTILWRNQLEHPNPLLLTQNNGGHLNGRNHSLVGNGQYLLE